MSTAIPTLNTVATIATNTPIQIQIKPASTALNQGIFTPRSPNTCASYSIKVFDGNVELVWIKAYEVKTFDENCVFTTFSVCKSRRVQLYENGTAVASAEVPQLCGWEE